MRNAITLVLVLLAVPVAAETTTVVLPELQLELNRLQPEAELPQLEFEFEQLLPVLPNDGFLISPVGGDCGGSGACAGCCAIKYCIDNHCYPPPPDKLTVPVIFWWREILRLVVAEETPPWPKEAICKQ